MTKQQDIETRFWSKVDRRDPDECWPWLGTPHNEGYGRFYPYGDRPSVRAHRYAYELLVEPIPTGLVIDHLCRNPICVNPAHMEPVTPRVNILRGVGATARNSRKTHCNHGHPFTPENTRFDRLKRKCRTCDLDLGMRTRRAQGAPSHSPRAYRAPVEADR